MKSTLPLLLAVLIGILSASLPAHLGLAADEKAKPDPIAALSPEDREAWELGRMLKAVQAALRDPAKPGALEAIQKMGTLTEYYGLVRGWLVQELAAAESIRDANKEADKSIHERIAFLRKAIRAIDLEK